MHRGFGLGGAGAGSGTRKAAGGGGKRETGDERTDGGRGRGQKTGHGAQWGTGQTDRQTRKQSSRMSKTSIEDLQEQINDLKSQVVKQRAIIAKTAQQMLSMQVKDTKQHMDSIPDPLGLGGAGGAAAAVDTADFATNEDLVQLVGELQGQLNLLEQKSVLRTVNSHQHRDSDVLLALPNLDGDMPASEVFPHSVAEFVNLGDDVVVQLCKFYQLLPPTLEERARMQAFVEGKIASPNEPLNGDYEPPADDYPPETLAELFVELANFIGVSHIKKRED